MTISEEGNVQIILNRGHAALWDHDWNGAVQAYNEALSLTPDHRIGLSSLGLALFHQKNYRESLRIFQQLAQQSPDDPMPMERIARIYEREGLLPEAIRSYHKAAELQLKYRDVDRSLSDYRAILHLNPENQDVRARIAMIFTKLGRKAEAVAEFIDLAAVIQKAGNPDKAMQVLEYARQVKPDSTEVANTISLLKNSQGIPFRKTDTEATGALRMAQVREIETSQAAAFTEVSGDPLTEARLKALETIASELFEDFDGAARQSTAPARNLFGHPSQGGVPDPKRVQIHLSEAINLLSAGKEAEGTAELERAIDGGYTSPAAHYLVGLLKKESDPQKAVQYLQKSVLSPEYALPSHLTIGEISINHNQLKEATSSYLHALMEADRVTVPEEQAEELVQLYEPIFESQTLITQEKDMRNLCSVISGQLTRPDWRDYLQGARAQLPAQPQGSPPLPLAEMLMDSSSSQVVDSLAEIRRLVQQGKYRSAMEESFRAVSYAPTYLPLHIQMGEILINEGRVTEAIEKFLMVANLYTIRGDSKQAIRLLSRVTRLAPMDTTIRKRLIEMLRNDGQNEETVQQHMDLANVYYLLADLEGARNNYHVALNLSRQIHSPRDQSVKILNHLADIELQSLNWKEAIKVYEQLRSLLPLDPGPRTALVDLYFRLGIPPAAVNEADAFLKLLDSENKSQDAEVFLDELINERPDNPNIQQLMAGYYISRNEFGTAILKLDALAEKLLVEKKVDASAAVISQIIALNPPNRSEYEQLYHELTKK